MYAKDVAELTELILKNSADDNFSIKQHVKECFGINDITKCWQSFDAFHTVNWVANCVKHYDGHPLKDKTPVQYIQLSKTERIKLTVKHFQTDCQAVIDFYPKFLEIVIRMGQHRVVQIQSERIDLLQMKIAVSEIESKLKEMLILIKPMIVDESNLNNSDTSMDNLNAQL